MKANVGSVDRAIRIVAGGALVASALAGVVGPWAYLGLVPLLTGVFRFCPAYRLFGFSSCSSR